MSSGDLDCFIDLGAYKVCDASQDLSNDLSVLLLMMQALVSRLLLPGISNFVNASVRRLHPRACCSTSYSCRWFFLWFVGRARLTRRRCCTRAQTVALAKQAVRRQATMTSCDDDAGIELA